jgi:transposase InsO family protein
MSWPLQRGRPWRLSAADWPATAADVHEEHACGDNAAMASFFDLLQRNVLDRPRWTTRELRLATVTWIERTYHRRRQRRLGSLTPIETLDLAATGA